jgi:hypothetical protein
MTTSRVSLARKSREGAWIVSRHERTVQGVRYTTMRVWRVEVKDGRLHPGPVVYEDVDGFDAEYAAAARARVDRLHKLFSARNCTTAEAQEIVEEHRQRRLLNAVSQMYR